VRSILAAISDVGFSGDTCRSPDHEEGTGFDPLRSLVGVDRHAAHAPERPSPETPR
jgi:hypothetical protein